MALGSTITQITDSGIKPGITFPSLNATGIITASNFKTGTSNLHNVGLEVAQLNVLGGNTKIGSGATVYFDGSIRTSGIVTATTYYGSGANLTGIDATTLKDSAGNIKAQANSHGVVITGVHTAATLSVTSNATIGGNLGVVGTLTYEDVTRVDALGLSTYREGLHVGPLAGIGATVYKDGSIRTSGIVTASSFVGSGANLTDLSSAEIYGFTGIGSHLEVRTTNKGADNVTGAQYTAFEQVMFAASGITWSINNDGNLIATI